MPKLTHRTMCSVKNLLYISLLFITTVIFYIPFINSASHMPQIMHNFQLS